ncbi:MAG: hypothetical protein QOG30_3349 [Acidimicrobiaceae bacterium]
MDEFDLSIDMIDELLSEHAVDAILSGQADVETTAPALQRVVQLVDVARSTAVPEEVAGEDALVDAVLGIIGATQGRVDVQLQRHRRAKRRMAKAVAAVAMVALSGTAAAMTNHLPDAVQSTISDAGSHVGLHLPTPEDDTKSGTTSDTNSDDPSADASTDSTQDRGPDATGPAKAGLCTAHFARGVSPSDQAGGVAEQNLQTAAADAGQSVEEFCADAVHESSSSSDASDAAPDTSEASDDTKSKGPKPDSGKPADSSSASDHPNNGKKPASSPGGGPAAQPGS